MGPQLDKTAGPNGVRSCTGICRRAGKRIKIQFKRTLVDLCSPGEAKLRTLGIVHRTQRARGRRAQAVQQAPDMAGAELLPIVSLVLHAHNLAAAKVCKLANVAATNALHQHACQEGQTAAACCQHKGVIARNAPQV